jgi:hypothetical protein
LLLVDRGEQNPEISELAALLREGETQSFIAAGEFAIELSKDDDDVAAKPVDFLDWLATVTSQVSDGDSARGRDPGRR